MKLLGDLVNDPMSSMNFSALESPVAARGGTSDASAVPSPRRRSTVANAMLPPGAARRVSSIGLNILDGLDDILDNYSDDLDLDQDALLAEFASV